MKKFIAGAIFMVNVNFAGAVTIGSSEWRQVSETVGFSYNDVSTVCNVATGNCAGSLNGVVFDGWKWASIDEVRDMFTELFSKINGTTFTELSPEHTQIDSLWAPYLIDVDKSGLDAGLFSATDVGNPNYSRVNGITRSHYTTFFGDKFARMATFLDRQPGDRDVASTNIGTSDLGNGRFKNGFWMYRSKSVTEPDIVFLFSFGLILIVLIRKNRPGRLAHENSLHLVR